MSPTHAKCGTDQSSWAILQTPERGLWVPVRAEILINFDSLACWRGRDLWDRRARTYPSEPRTPARSLLPRRFLHLLAYPQLSAKHLCRPAFLLRRGTKLLLLP